MKHVTPVSRIPSQADGVLNPAEQLVILLLGIFFADNPNLGPVLQNLEKFYRKTPS